MARQSKKAKADRDVQYCYSANGVERCGFCSMFVKPCHCTEVEGVISDRGWCRLYSQRGAGLPRRSNQV